MGVSIKASDLPKPTTTGFTVVNPFSAKQQIEEEWKTNNTPSFFKQPESSQKESSKAHLDTIQEVNEKDEAKESKEATKISQPEVAKDKVFTAGGLFKKPESTTNAFSVSKFPTKES